MSVPLPAYLSSLSCCFWFFGHRLLCFSIWATFPLSIPHSFSAGIRCLPAPADFDPLYGSVPVLSDSSFASPFPCLDVEIQEIVLLSLSGVRVAFRIQYVSSYWLKFSSLLTLFFYRSSRSSDSRSFFPSLSPLDWSHCLLRDPFRSRRFWKEREVVVEQIPLSISHFRVSSRFMCRHSMYSPFRFLIEHSHLPLN